MNDPASLSGAGKQLCSVSSVKSSDCDLLKMSVTALLTVSGVRSSGLERTVKTHA